MISEIQKEALIKFNYLWKLENQEWVNERKAQWKLIAETNFSDTSAKSLKKYATFFMKGEREEYIGETLQFVFTPYNSPQNAKEIFYSRLFTPYDRSRIFSGFISSASKLANGMPWLRQHIQFFVEGILGDTYRLIQEQDGPDMRTISPGPEFWCFQYIAIARDVINEEWQYHGVIDCVDYFISALFHFSSERKEKKINSLLEDVEACLSRTDCSVWAKELSEKLKLHEKRLIDAKNV